MEFEGQNTGEQKNQYELQQLCQVKIQILQGKTQNQIINKLTFIILNSIRNYYKGNNAGKWDP